MIYAFSPRLLLSILGWLSALSLAVSQPLSVSVNVADTTICSGGSVQLVADIQGGTPPYRSNWMSLGGTTDSLLIANRTQAGDFTIVVYDEMDNTAVAEVVVQIADPITVDFQSTEPACAGDNTGTVSVQTTGLAPFTYQWSDGGTGANRTGLAAGNYELSVTDALGCTTSFETQLNQPRLLEFGLTLSDASCQGSVDTEVLGGVGGGTRPYSYLWSDGGTEPDRFLPPGESGLTVTDANGCTIDTLITIRVRQPGEEAPTIDLEATQLTLQSACGVNDGAIDLVVNGGVPPFDYYWSNQRFFDADTEDISGLEPGTYSVFISDANGCTNQATFRLPQAVELSLDEENTSVTDVSCFDASDGQISAAVIGGEAPYTYTWSNGATGPVITGLSFNSYFLTVTDANDCQLQYFELFVDRPQRLQVTTAFTRVSPATCPASRDGVIDIRRITGGVPPYRFELATGEVLAQLDSLAVGTYTITVLDANDCRAPGGTYTVEGPEPLSGDPDWATVFNGFCGGEENNFISPGFRGGTFPLAFRWSNGASDFSLFAVPPGEYEVTISDFCGASFTQSFTLGEAEERPAVEVSETICAGESVRVGGQVFTEAGTYTVTIPSVVSPECDSTIVLDLRVNPLPEVSVGEDQEICAGGSVRIRGNPGFQNIGQWSPTTGLFQAGSREPLAAPDRTQVYVYTATTPQGCVASDSVEVAVNPLLNPVADAGPTIVTCKEEGTIGVRLGGNPSSQVPPANPNDELIRRVWYLNEQTNFLTTEENPLLGASAGDYFTLALETESGCRDTSIVEVVYEPAFELTLTTTDSECPGRGFGRIDLEATGGTPPYTLRWDDLPGQRPFEDRTNLRGGLYFVTVTDAAGCNQIATAEILEPPFAFNPVVIQPQCGETTGRVIIGLESPLEWDVSVRFIETQEVVDPDNLSPGWYQIDLVRGDCGIAWEFEIVEFDDTNCGGLRGFVRLDANANCVVEPEEVSEANQLVEAAGATNTFYTYADEEGSYQLDIPAGAYDLSVVAPTPNWTDCAEPVRVMVSNEGETQLADLPLSPLAYCPEVTVHLTTPFLRRCFESSYYVNVCNYGTVETEDYRLVLELDEGLSYLSAQLPPATVEGQTLTWERPNLARGGCYSFRVDVAVSCEVPLGTTHCSELRAESGPLENICTPGNDNWSGATLELAGECTGDSVVFIVSNPGEVPYLTDANYTLMRDTFLLEEGVLTGLGAGRTQQFAYPADGATYHFRIDQAVDHPYSTSLGYTIEACGEPENGAPSQGVVVQYPWGHSRPLTHTFCQDNIGSFDPNDKTAFPAGIGARHNIYPETELNYRIRFQNTGTDTAFTVVIVDTIAPELDLRSLQIGTASHPFRVALEADRVLTFTFDDILLPDSTTNLAASQGFVDFMIQLQPDLPLGTRVENQAAIYFDFNEPIFTNTTFHTVDEDFLERVDWLPSLTAEVGQWRFFPNPAAYAVRVEVQAASAQGQNGNLRLLDMYGRRVQDLTLSAGAGEFSVQHLPAAVYTLQWWSTDGRLLGSERVVVK